MMQNYDLKQVNYGNTFKGVKFNLPSEVNYSLGDSAVREGLPIDFADQAITYYLHFAYADNKHGLNFNKYDPAGMTYVGYYVDQAESDSNTASDYTWVLISGAHKYRSIRGLQNIPSSIQMEAIPQEQPTDPEADPIPDVVPYIHIAHSDDDDTFSDIPSAYIGVYVDETEENSTDVADYTWIPVVGWLVARIMLQLRTTPDGNAVATMELPHIDDYSFEIRPFVVKYHPEVYYYDILILFLDGREKTYIGGTWTINQVITKRQ